MSRPLMQYGVAHLEEMFAKAESDLKVLKQLESELKCRQVPRAVALLTHVQKVIRIATGSTGTLGDSLPGTHAATPVAQQSKLFERPHTDSRGAQRSSVVIKTQPLSMALPPPQQPTATAADISISDAYKLLSATPLSTWTSIEQTRRQMVQQAHPSRVAAFSAAKRAQIETDAVQVNTAYLKLSTLRCES